MTNVVTIRSTGRATSAPRLARACRLAARYVVSPIVRALCSLPVAIVLCSTLPAHASKEAVLALDKFQVSSPGIGQSGPVVVSGEQEANRVVSLAVQAFGRTVNLSPEQLAKLRGGFINGIQISYEAGYRQLGGRTVYVILSKGFTSGLQETQLVSVNENGLTEVSDVIRK